MKYLGGLRLSLSAMHETKTGLTSKGINQINKSIAGNKGRGASIVVDWFAELGRDQEDLGSISATSKRFSGNQSL